MATIDREFLPLTYDYMLESYKRRTRFVLDLPKRLHRLIGLNYLVHAMLEVSGRADEILDAELTIAEPNYVFHHTGARYRGREAVGEFYGALVDGGSNVIVSTDHRMAIADWGLSLDQVSHTNVALASLQRLELPPPLTPGDIYVEHRRTMRIWPYNDRGQMIGENLFYAFDATYSLIPAEAVMTRERVAQHLAPVIDEVRERYRVERAVFNPEAHQLAQPSLQD